jgi:hypothetical protein
VHKVNIYCFEIGKSNVGLKHEALETIYTGGILPLILYGAPVWKGTLQNTFYKAKLIGIQMLINIRIATHHVTAHNTPVHNILSTVPQLSISQKAGTLPEDGNVMPKRIGTTVRN